MTQEERNDLLEQLIDEVNISQVLDSACNGALESITDQLDRLDIPDDEMREELKNEIFVNYISIT
jgi:hypothetical protein